MERKPSFLSAYLSLFPRVFACGLKAYLRIGVLNIELRHIVQSETGQTAVRCFAVAAAAINTNNAIARPEAERRVTNTVDVQYAADHALTSCKSCC